MKKIPREDFIDPTYRSLMESKRGRKLIRLFRLLTEGIMTKREIAVRIGFSESEVRELIAKGLEKGYIALYKIERVHRRRGKPVSGEYERDTGRPPNYYYLTGEGKWLMRLDPEVRDSWSTVKVTYERIVEHSIFDSYADLVYAIRKHPQLKEYQKPYYFMRQELQLNIFNPFIYGGPRIEEEENVYDKLVEVLAESVRPEHITGYYRALEDSRKKISRILARHNLLMEKMEALPEVREYLDHQKTLME